MSLSDEEWAEFCEQSNLDDMGVLRMGSDDRVETCVSLTKICREVIRGEIPAKILGQLVSDITEDWKKDDVSSLMTDFILRATIGELLLHFICDQATSSDESNGKALVESLIELVELMTNQMDMREITAEEYREYILKVKR